MTVSNCFTKENIEKILKEYQDKNRDIKFHITDILLYVTSYTNQVYSPSVTYSFDNEKLYFEKFLDNFKNQPCSELFYQSNKSKDIKIDSNKLLEFIKLNIENCFNNYKN